MSQKKKPELKAKYVYPRDKNSNQIIDSVDRASILRVIQPKLDNAPSGNDPVALEAYNQYVQRMRPFLEQESIHVKRPKMPPVLRETLVKRSRINQLLQATGWNYRELIEVCTRGVPLIWGCDIEQQMAEICDQLTEEECRWLTEYITNILPQPVAALLTMRRERMESDQRQLRYTSGYMLFRTVDTIKPVRAKNTAWRNQAVELSTSIQTEVTRCSSQMSEDQRETLGTGTILTNAYKYDYGYTELPDIPFRLYPYVLKALPLSPHWLLGLGDAAVVLCKNIRAESVMDAFCLLPEQHRRAVLSGVLQCASERKEHARC